MCHEAAIERYFLCAHSKGKSDFARCSKPKCRSIKLEPSFCEPLNSPCDKCRKSGLWTRDNDADGWDYYGPNPDILVYCGFASKPKNKGEPAKRGDDQSDIEKGWEIL